MEHDLAELSCGHPAGTPRKLGWRELPCLSCRHIQFWYGSDCFERLSGLRGGDVLDYPGCYIDSQLHVLRAWQILQWDQHKHIRILFDLSVRHLFHGGWHDSGVSVPDVLSMLGRAIQFDCLHQLCKYCVRGMHKPGKSS